MTYSAPILIADDELSFRESTSRLLIREGFDCQCAEDADQALELLKECRFDVLIADIRMPQNTNLRLVREAQKLDREMAVIIVTGFPSAETAITSIGLPVAAYLTKPLDFDELLANVRSAAQASQRWRVIDASIARLQSCLTDLEAMKARPPRCRCEFDEVSGGTLRTLASCLSELLELSAKTAKERKWQCLCQMLDCPQTPVCLEAIGETIRVLEESKKMFKSKPLASLRIKLEELIGRL